MAARPASEWGQAWASLWVVENDQKACVGPLGIDEGEAKHVRGEAALGEMLLWGSLRWLSWRVQHIACPVAPLLGPLQVRTATASGDPSTSLFTSLTDIGRCSALNQLPNMYSRQLAPWRLCATKEQENCNAGRSQVSKPHPEPPRMPAKCPQQTYPKLGGALQASCVALTYLSSQQNWAPTTRVGHGRTVYSPLTPASCSRGVPLRRTGREGTNETVDVRSEHTEALHLHRLMQH